MYVPNFVAKLGRLYVIGYNLYLLVLHILLAVSCFSFWKFTDWVEQSNHPEIFHYSFRNFTKYFMEYAECRTSINQVTAFPNAFILLSVAIEANLSIDSFLCDALQE